MRCSVCQRRIDGPAYAFSRIDVSGRTLNMFACTGCTIGILGPADRRRLDAALVQAGWVQEPLPNL